MSKWGMVIDVSKCTGCFNCFTACKDEHWNNDYPPYSAAQPRFGQFWMNVKTIERGMHPFVKVSHIPIPCMHCEDAPCIKAAKDGAVYKTDEGIVIIDTAKAVGQKQIVDACPFGAIYWNEETKLPQKCTFCAPRLEKGAEPRCVQACPSAALIFGDLDDPSSEVAKLVASGKTEAYNEMESVKPRVRYIGLPKMFIAAAVVLGDVDECAKGAKVTLSGAASATEEANTYGEFCFEGLKPGKYTVKVEYAGYASQTVEVDLADTKYLGDIVLSR